MATPPKPPENHKPAPHPAHPAPPAPVKHEEPPKAEKTEAAPPKPAQHSTVLDPTTALLLFKNGHRIAVDGAPGDQWISMGRALDGVELYQQPLTQALIDQITSGSYYLVEDQAAYTVS